MRDWHKDKRYLEELNEWERDPDDEDLYKIASHWHAEAERWRLEAFRQYPTPEAYDAACAALHKHRERAEAAEARENKLRESLERILKMTNKAEAYTVEARVYHEAFKTLSSLYGDKEEEAK